MLIQCCKLTLSIVINLCRGFYIRDGYPVRAAGILIRSAEGEFRILKEVHLTEISLIAALLTTAERHKPTQNMPQLKQNWNPT